MAALNWEELRSKHHSLAANENVGTLELQELLQLLEEIRELGRDVDNTSDREELAQLARELGEMCFRNFGQYPTTRLRLPKDVLLSEKAADQIIELDIKFRRLARELTDLRDFKTLVRAIQEAEVLDDEGKLPHDLKDVLKQARIDFDEHRRKQGEMTTFMRFGDLATRKKAVEQLIEMELSGYSTVYNAARDEVIPISDALGEALSWYNERAELELELQIQNIDLFSNDHPHVALQRLRALEEQDLFDGFLKNRLLTRIAELEEQADRFSRASALVDESIETPDVVHCLQQLLHASAIYPKLPGLDTRLEYARRAAQRSVEVRASTLMKKARHSLAMGEVRAAQELVYRIRDYISHSLQGLELNVSSALQEELKALFHALVIHKDYDAKAHLVRAWIADPVHQSDALELHREMLADEKFVEISDLHLLTHEIKAMQRALGD